MRAPFTLLAAALLLTACADLANRDRLPVEPATPVTVKPAVPLPERKPTPPPRRKPAAPQDRPAAGAEAPAAAAEANGTGAANGANGADAATAAGIDGAAGAPQQASRPPARRPIPDSLTGLSADELRSIMGAPAQEVAEAPGVRWRYRGTGCTLDVHLFPRVESQGLFALDMSAEGLPAARCLDTFRAPPAEAAPAAQPAQPPQAPEQQGRAAGAPQPLLPAGGSRGEATSR